jgi:DNA-binding NarL/FixJ family response regulator
LGDIVANAVTLVLADHHVVVAEGLGMLLDVEDDLVLDLAHHLAETLAAAKAASPTTKLLVLSGDAHPDTTAAVLSSGADGCLAKDRSSRQVATALRQLAAGEKAVVTAPEPRLDRDPGVELRVRTLTPREREILGLLTIGWSNRRIAEATQLSYLTVRSHTQNLLLKLGVHSQLEAVAFAVEHGIVNARGTRARERRSA